MGRSHLEDERTRTWIAAGIGFALGLLFILGVRWWFRLGVVDDALILARYARNWIGGGGLAFNPGQRVEGYTSFTWVFLSALLGRVGISPDRGVALLSIVAGAGGAALLAGWVGRRQGLFPAALASLSLLLLPSWTCWAGSGMDACGFAVLWTISLALYAASRGARTRAAAGILAAFTAMTRPEGCLLPLVWGIYEAPRGRDRRRFLTALAAFALLFGAYFIWRWSYFGYPFPNTYYAKVDGFRMALCLRGLRYLGGFLGRMAPLLLVGLIVWWKGPRKSSAGGTLPLFAIGAGVLATLGIAVVGGDHFPLDRFGVHLLPSLLCLIWLAPDWSVRPRISRTALLIAVLLGNVLSWPQAERFFTEADLARGWTQMGRRLAVALPPGSSVATYFVGAVGYYSGQTILDMQGITEPRIAHEKRELGRGYAGHEKYDSAYILARRPDAILLEYELHPQAVDTGDPERSLWGNAALDLFRRPAFREFYVHQALPVGDQFMHLYLRRSER